MIKTYSPIGNVQKLVPNFFDKEKYAIHYENLKLYLRLGLKLKKNTLRIRIQSIIPAKTIVEFNTHKRIEAETNGDKDGKADKQSCIRKSNGKLKKLNRCKTCEQQVGIQTKLYAAQNI